MNRRQFDDLREDFCFSDEDFKVIVREKSATKSEQAFHEEIEIKYFFEGESALKIGDKILLTKPGDITLVNPYELHSGVDIDRYNGRYCLFIVSVDFFANHPTVFDLRKTLITEQKKFQNNLSGNDRLRGILLSIRQEMTEQKPYYKEVVRGLISEFFILLLRDNLCKSETDTPMQNHAEKAALISPALSKIHSDYATKLSIHELANACHISDYYFCRIFKEVMGMTPMQYTVKHRLDIAAILLKDTEKSVADVAACCGFDDESYFYRCFKKYTGRSPKQASKTAR